MPQSNNWGLSEEQQAALKMPPGHPIRSGLAALFEAIKNGEYIEASDPKLTSDQRHYKAGRMAALSEFEAFLEQLYEHPIDNSE